ncbi:hypothetical protein FB480_10539 [Agrobacterium vitis]|nr:hypothetical protein FB480_10539 [Agrobacterium vitis]
MECFDFKVRSGLGLLVTGLALTLMSSVSNGAEFGQTTLPGGTSDIRAAELPPEPGFYLLGGAAGVWQNRFTDNNGNNQFPDTFNKVGLVNFGGLYVYPGTFLGGRLASSFVMSAGDHRLVVTKTLPVNLTGKHQGFFDAYSDLFIWSKSWYDKRVAGQSEPQNASGEPGLPTGFSFAMGLGIGIPMGQFEKTNVVSNLGFNTWTLSPNIAFTYRTKPILLDATEFSTKISYNHPFNRDDSTGGFTYRDGDYISADFAVTERYSRYQFGLAGNVRQQVTDDRGTPAMPATNGQRLYSLRLGPVLAIDFPEIGAGLTFKYLRDIDSRNAFEGDALQVSFVKKLW